MRMKDRERESALYLLRKSGLQLVDAARLVLDLVEGCGGVSAGGALFERCRRAVVLGVQARQEEELSVPFAEAVEYTRQVKRHRAARTQSDISYYMRRLMRAVPWLAGRALRSLTAQDCRRALEQAYHTPSQLKKARAIMSGVFSVGRRQGWCGENPVLLVEVPAVREQEIAPLPLAAVQQLVQTAHAAEHRAVLPALGLMLHAGCARRKWCACAGRMWTWRSASCAFRRATAKPAAPDIYPCPGRCSACWGSSGAVGASARRTGTPAGSDYAGRRDLPPGCRMCFAIPLRATISSTTTIWRRCS